MVRPIIIFSCNFIIIFSPPSTFFILVFVSFFLTSDEGSRTVAHRCAILGKKDLFDALWPFDLENETKDGLIPFEIAIQAGIASNFFCLFFMVE